MNESASDIRYLVRQDIDTAKWDQCIQKSSNGMIYAYSFYLDAMAKNWSALVLKDYEAVMPLTWNKKFGIAYLYQPPFTAQLGVFFSTLPVNPAFSYFIEQARLHFKFCEIHLNFANPPAGFPMRANYILRLGLPYNEIRKGYKKRLLENLQEAEPHQLQYQNSEDFGSIIRLFEKQYGRRFPHVKKSDFEHFEILCGELFKRKMIFARLVKDKNGGLLSNSIYLTDERRIYNIMSVTLPIGREKRAHFYLLDQLINEFSIENLVLDFEGSEIPGIAEFYRKFGSVSQPYPFLKFNSLPFPLRLFK